ncbi:MAG: hypothetical protein GYA62_11360, partial [Bacteroidales bacterium]|nr:hypothetical protein [Bacteroidales bacterium]
MKKFVFLVVFAAFGLVLNAQPLKSFSDKPEEYIVQLKEMIEAKDKKVGKEIYEAILPLWNGSYFNNSDKTSIISVSNELLQKRALPMPHFEEFERILLEFAKQNYSKNDFLEYLKGLSFLCRKKTATLNSIDNYMDNILNYLQKRYLSKTTTVKWKTRSSDSKFIFDGEQLLI